MYAPIVAVMAACSEALFYCAFAARLELRRARQSRQAASGLYARWLRRVPKVCAMLYRQRRAPRVWIRHEDEGFCANVLGVLDTIARARPDASIVVDWTLSGNERQFKYGEVGTNVWDQIFEPLDSREAAEAAEAVAAAEAPGDDICRVSRRWNPFLISVGRDLFSSTPLGAAMRRRYHRAYRAKIRIKNDYVLGEVAQGLERMRDRRRLGVHKRLSTVPVAMNQRSCRVPTNAEVLRHVAHVAARYGQERPVIYLATDDRDCVAMFTEYFGKDLVCRQDVQRVGADDQTEVHTQEWGKVGLKDACDVLIDVLLLAECDEVVHLSSNVSTLVSFVRPETTLTHYDDIEEGNRATHLWQASVR